METLRCRCIGMFLMLLSLFFPRGVGFSQEARNGEPPEGTVSPAPAFEMDETVVKEKKMVPYREEIPVGPYQQPQWTTVHQNGAAVYVRPPGKIEALLWVDVDIPQDRTGDAHSEISTIFELEIGLPYRFQLDFFLETIKYGGNSGPLELAGESVELRWALADWGKIWGNPTIYLEYYYANNRRPSEMEAKLLLGGRVAPGWHWGVNLLYEQELADEYEREFALKLMLGRVILDEKLTLGVAGIVEIEKDEEEGGEWEAVPMLGPRLRFSPLPALHLDLIGYVGLTGEAPVARPVFLAAWDF
jgi:hypothetical protein